MARDEAYREAERRIEEARRSGAMELYLGGINLREIPEAIASFSQLRVLYLSNNQLKEIPETIASLTQLRVLNLSNNQLKEISETIASLTQLKELNLSYNQLQEIPEVIASLTQLKELNLSYNQLKEILETIASLTQLKWLNLSYNQLQEIPEVIASLTQLKWLYLDHNQLQEIPEVIASLTQLRELYLNNNQLQEIPEAIASLHQLELLDISSNQLQEIPEAIASLHQLELLDISNNQLQEIPKAIASLHQLRLLELDGNPLNPDLAAADEQGLDAVKQYLRAKAEGQIILYEAKLILVGEGEVGKSCLLRALRGDTWQELPTTHGIEIKELIATDPANGNEITLNGWDFGGQRVYRPTHQLFFSAPAVYLVVWKPREGPQQGFVKEWITLIKHREPGAKVLVVATHGGIGQRQPDIDRQELRDLFGDDTILGFFSVDSKPDSGNSYTGIAKLKDAIALAAAALPLMGQSVPAKWQRVRKNLQTRPEPYLSYPEVMALCQQQGMDEAQAELFIQISHRLGHFTHYHHDAILKDIVILKPDWLAKAISFVLDDPETRIRNGLVEFAHLSHLWSNPPFEGETGYPTKLHPLFLRLMERFDLSYKVKIDPDADSTTSLIAQLVPDNRPDRLPWGDHPENGDRQQVQICQIVSDRGDPAQAEGLFYQLIVRLHRYSLGRDNYADSIHWQKGLMLDNDYQGRALLEYSGTEIKITVRAAYPERFLSYLTEEIEWLIESSTNPFAWKGLHCNVMVPCREPCGKNTPGHGLFEIQKLIESKKKNRPDFPCPISGCDEWQNIDRLLANAPTAQPSPALTLDQIQDVVKEELKVVLIRTQEVSQDVRTLLTRGDEQFAYLMKTLTDEAKDGPRLFSLKPMDPTFFDRPQWLSAKFQITLWCEHSRQPLPALNPPGSTEGIYELDIPRAWFVKAAPLIKTMSTVLSLFLPLAGSAIKLNLDDTSYKAFEEQLDFGQKALESVLKSSDLATDWQSEHDTPNLGYGDTIRAEGFMLRTLHALLKEKDPSFGGLEKVQNNRREFLWVHPQFMKEY